MVFLAIEEEINMLSRQTGIREINFPSEPEALTLITSREIQENEDNLVKYLIISRQVQTGTDQQLMAIISEPQILKIMLINIQSIKNWRKTLTINASMVIY